MKSAREIFEERKKKESSTGKVSASTAKATPVKNTTSARSARDIFEERQRERGFGTPTSANAGTRPVTAASAMTPAVIGAKVAANVPMPTKQPQESLIPTLGKPLIKSSAAEWAMEAMKRAEARLDENEFKTTTSGMTPMQGVGFRPMQSYQQQKQRERTAKLNAYERAYAEAIAGGDKETAQLLGYMLKQKEPDFRENSKYVSTKQREPEYNYWTGMYNDTGYGDNEYEIINRNTDVENMVDAAEWELILNAAGEGDQELNNLTAEELGVYNYLYAMDKKNGTDDAKQFMKLMSGDLRARQRAEWEEQAKKFAEESPVGASVFNVLTSPRKTVSGVMQIADYLDDGEIDKNAGYNRAIYEGATRHATVSEMIDKNAGGVASFLYDAGMSAAENLYNMALGGGKAGSLALMGTTSFSTGVSNAIDRGLSAEQALGLGTISAAAEIITENIGYGAIMESIQKGGASAFKKSLIQNGLEEMSSATVNSIADTIIARDKSYWNMKVAEYKKQGMSEAEAFGMALLDTTLEIGKEGVAGVVSAGMMTGPSNIMQNYSQGKAFKDAEVPKEYLQGIITEGLTSEEGSSNRKLAEKLKKQLDVGQSISFYDYGKLYRENLANRGNAEIPDEEDFTKAGFTKTKFSGKITNKQIRALDAIGKALGVNISIGAPTGSGEGAYNGFYDNGRIVIAQDADNPLEVVLAHEVTHHMKRTSPVEYQKFVELAVNASEKLSGEEKAKIINEYKTMYSEGTGSNFTDTQAIDELAADFTKNIVKDIKAFRNLINADKNVAQRFLEGVKNFITKVKSTFSNDKKKMDTAAQEKYGASISELEAAVSSWEKMFAETEAGVKDGKLHNLSMNEAVEETNDLIAVHNASEDQIIEALRRGQFFMPSVAVTNKGFSKFGDISVVFNKGTIDPEESGENRLYGSDAWTPIQTELKKNPKFDEGAVEEALYGIRETIGEGAEQLFTDDAENFKQKIAAADGSLYNAYAKDMGMQAAYAIEKGLISGIPTDGSGNIDTEKLKAELDAVMDADSEWRAYKKWLSGISGEVITSYDRASDEDIMRTMEAQPDYAKRFKLSKEGELTAPVVPYTSIEDFRRNKGRLSDTAEEDTKALGAEMLELAEKISKNSGVDLSKAVDAINNAFIHRYSQSDIVQSFKDSGARISRKNADILQGLYRRAVELSTPYFEAKPQRGVGTEEIAAVVIPDNTSAELKKQLSDEGIRVVEYEAGNEADRLSKMKALEDVKFALKKNTDNMGRELSAEQAEYFKDSKVRDKDGNLITVYHGTQRGGFTVFNRTYNWYTDNSEMAQSYTQSPDIYEGYLNIKKPYIIDAKGDKWSGIAIDEETKELLDQYGSSTFKENGEWRTSTADIVSAVFDAIEEGEADYDGVIILNVNDFGSYYKGDISGIGNDYISFKSSQFKNIDNKTPTENPDIRYSLKVKSPIEPNAEKIAERERMQELEAENAKQKKLIEQLKDRMKNMSPNKVAGAVDEKAVQKAARELVRRYSSTVKASDIAPRLKKLWDRIGTGRGLVWEEVSAEAKAIATELAESAVEKDDTLYQEFADLRKFMRDTTITISESDRSNIPDFADFRKRNMGRMKIGHGETNVDQIFKELGEMYPGMFDEESISHPADQLMRISEVLGDVYKITESNPFKNNMDYAVNSIANDILETFYEIPENKKTFQEMKIQRLERTILERDAQIKETQKVLNQYHKSVEKMLADYEKKIKDAEEKKIALKEERQRFYEKQDERKKRAQIIRATNKLSQKLRWATDKKHIPYDLQGAVARFLEDVNLTGLYTYDERGKLRKSDEGEPTRKSLEFRELKAIYKKYDGELTFPTEFFEGVFEDGKERGDILERIHELRDTRVAAMNKDQLNVVLQGVKIVETAIKNADRMFSNSRFKEISELANTIKDNAPIKEEFGTNRLKTKMKEFFDTDNLTPEAYFHRLGKGGDAVFNMLSDAEGKRTRIMKEVEDFTGELLSNDDRRKFEKEVVEVTLAGEKTEMSVAQIMELYALSRREQAKDHIVKGGITLEGISGKKGKIRRLPQRATVEEIGKAIDKLTPEQRKIAEKLSKFASDKLGGYMNEACRKVFGYEKFGERNYWPIRVDDRTIHKKADTADASKITPTIRNFGMAQATTQGADNALKIGSIFDTFSSHTATSATYAAYLGAMEDMRRILNFTYDNGEGMQHVLDGVFGISQKGDSEKHPGIDYWNKLYEDINGGMKPKDGGSPFDPLLRNAKLTSVAANARVVIQQPTSYLRAGSEIDYKYLAKGARHFKRGWERALKYAPIAQQKDWGRADMGTGQTTKEILFGADGAIPKIQEWSLWAAGKADAIAWGSLWSACEAEVRDKSKKIKPDSEAFFEAVEKRFTQIVNKTQVVDGVLQRSQNMRKQNALVKLGTMFMSEPTKQYNMLSSAVYDWAHSKGKESKRAARQKLGRTATSLVVSIVLNAAATSLVDAMRDDDKEKDYWEKWLSAFLGTPGEGEGGVDAVRSILKGNITEGLNPIGYFPFAKDLLSIAQGYDVKRTDIEGLGDLVNTAGNVIKTFGEGSKQSIAADVNDLIATGATLFGIPYKSFKRDVGALARSVIRGIGNPVLDYEVEKLTKNIKNEKNAGDFIDILYNAKQKDKEAYEIIYNNMIKNGFKKDDLDKKLAKYTSGEFDRTLSAAKKAKESEDATDADKVIYTHLNREKNMSRDVRAGDEDTVIANLDKYRKKVDKYLGEYPGKDPERKREYAYYKANYDMYGAKYAIRASGGADTYKKALEKVQRGKTTWDEYYDSYFGRDERRYEVISKKYGITYEQFEKIAEAMSKGKDKEEEIKEIQKILNCKYNKAMYIRSNYENTK